MYSTHLLLSVSSLSQREKRGMRDERRGGGGEDGGRKRRGWGVTGGRRRGTGGEERGMRGLHLSLPQCLCVGRWGVKDFLFGLQSHDHLRETLHVT